jgi:hypothetical protein
MDGRGGAYRFGRPEGKRPLGRPEHRWKYNIKMDLQEQNTQFKFLSCGTQYK